MSQVSKNIGTKNHLFAFPILSLIQPRPKTASLGASANEESKNLRFDASSIDIYLARIFSIYILKKVKKLKKDRTSMSRRSLPNKNYFSLS